MRVVACLLIALLSAATAVPVACAGWDGSAPGRRACCLRAHHEHCSDQAKADSCCAGHEQSRQAASIQPAPAAVVQAQAAILAPIFDATDFAAVVHAADVSADLKRLHDGPHLLIPPLRI